MKQASQKILALLFYVQIVVPELILIMQNKRYDPKLKDEYDGRGKNLSIEIMRDVVKAELPQINKEEDLGTFKDGFWDLRFIKKNGKEIIVESEMKNEKWWGFDYGSFPFKYETMDIPFRKDKNKAELHIVISTCENLAFMLLRKHMDQEFKKKGVPIFKPTIYAKNEPFFRTPVSRGKFVHRDKDNIWKFY